MSDILLKIGRNTYVITPEDRFMDNGSVVQLITQSKEKSDWGVKPDPVLSKKAIVQIESIGTVDYDHHYGPGVRVFSIKERD